MIKNLTKVKVFLKIWTTDKSTEMNHHVSDDFNNSFSNPIPALQYYRLQAKCVLHIDLDQ